MGERGEKDTSYDPDRGGIPNAVMVRAHTWSTVRMNELAHSLRARRERRDELLAARRPLYVLALLLMLVSLIVRLPALFIAGLVIVALLSLPEVWYRYGLRALHFTRKPTLNRAAFGDVTEVPLVVENRKLLPLPWLEMEDEFPDTLPVLGHCLELSSLVGRALLTNTFSLWAFQRMRRRYRVWAVARGVYTFGPAHLRIGDPFGVLTREEALPSLATLLVYPLIAPLERFGLSPHAPFGERATPRRILDDPLRIAGIRPYLPGDEPRRIHWKATARTGMLQSKVLEPSARHTLVIFLDTRTYANPHMGYDPALAELAISAAASVAMWGVKQGYAVGLLSNGSMNAPELADLLRRTGERDNDDDDQPQATVAADAIEQAKLQRRVVADASSEAVEAAIARTAAAMRLRIAPSSRPEQLRRILDGLARLLPYQGLPMSQLLAAERQQLPPGATVVYIGAETVVDVPTIVALRQLHTHGYMVSLLLTEPEDSEPIENAETDGRERHDLHLTNLPTHYLGGRREWQALVADTLGTDTPRKATTSLDDDTRSLEQRLLATLTPGRVATDTPDDPNAVDSSDDEKGGSRDESVRHTDADASGAGSRPADRPERAKRSLVVR